MEPLVSQASNDSIAGGDPVSEQQSPPDTKDLFWREESASPLSPDLEYQALTRANNLTKDQPSRLADFFAIGEEPRVRYSDWDLREISRHLQENQRHEWSQAPRLYTVLRTIGQLRVLDAVLDLGIGDFWFPFDSNSVPTVLSSSMRNRFLETQPLILTKAVDIEKDESKVHAHFGREDVFPFEIGEVLGRGNYGVVDKIFSPLSRRELARKRFVRRRASVSKGEVQSFRTELQVLKKIQHHHCIELIASYTDTKFFGLIMSPVADCNLSGFYVQAAESADKREILRGFFGCLMNGLHYLHSAKIRHRDIKPENILVKGSHVYLSDFGISLDWESLSGSTTTDDSGKSWIYCAPEVAHFEKRNSSSDIWSLGCVFLEMSTVLKGRKVDTMRQYFKDCSDNYRFYKNLTAIEDWSALLTSGSASDFDPLGWTASMLQRNPDSRPSAEELYIKISNTRQRIHSEEHNFCGECCAIDINADLTAESASDSDLWAENLDEETTSPPLTEDVGKPAMSQRSSSLDVVLKDSTDPIAVRFSAEHLNLTLENSAPSLKTAFKSLPDQGIDEAVVNNQPSKASSIKAAPPRPLAKSTEQKAQLSRDSSGQCADAIPRDDDLARIQSPQTSVIALSDPSDQTTRDTCEPTGKDLITTSIVTVNPIDNKAPLTSKSPTTTVAVPDPDKEANINDTHEVQNLDSWPYFDLSGILPTLGHMSWMSPSLLLESVKGDEVFMRFLLREVPEVYSLIQSATSKDLTMLMQLLVQNGFNVNSKTYMNSGICPLSHILSWGSEEFKPLFSFLVKAGASLEIVSKGEKGKTVFRRAGETGYIWAVKILIDAGADPNQEEILRNPLVGAAAHNQLDLVRYLINSSSLRPDLLKKTTGRHALFLASSNGHAEIVSFLINTLKDKIDLERYVYTNSLYSACFYGHLEVVKILLFHGADPNEECLGLSVLEKASWEGHIEIVKLLLENGADPNWNKRGRSVLEKASWEGHIEIVKLLLENGADPNWNKRGRSVLDEASWKGHIEIVRLLLENGAKMSTHSGPITFVKRALYGHWCIYLAKRAGHREIVQMLEEEKKKRKQRH